VETVLLRVLQGATISGLGGIPERRQFEPGVTLIRPMLDVPKAAIESFLRRSHLPWCEDPSNESDRFARNRVRNQILPEIRAAFPAAETAIARFARRNASAAAFIAREAQSRIPWEPRAGGYVVDADRFWSADPVLRVESIVSLMNREGDSDRVPARMLDVLRDRPKAGGVVMRGRGWTLYQLAGQLWYGRAVAQARESGYLFRVHGPGTCDVFLPFVPDSETTITVPWSGPIPLVVRSPRPGDTVEVGGLTKTLKRLLPECGVPRFQRRNVPIVEDRYGILAVVGSVTGGRERFSDRAAGHAGESVEIRLRGQDSRDTLD
jgi:tRNA(Ile)-lysidine synthase